MQLEEIHRFDHKALAQLLHILRSDTIMEEPGHQIFSHNNSYIPT